MKKILTLLLMCMMLTGLSITAYAGPSKEAEAEESDKPGPGGSQPGIPGSDGSIITSPQTGDSQMFVYSMMTACICAGVVTVSFRKVK